MTGDDARPPRAGRWVIAGPDDVGLAGALLRSSHGLEIYLDLGSVPAGPVVPELVFVPAPLPEIRSPAKTLARLREFLFDERFSGSRLVLVTRGVTTICSGDEVVARSWRGFRALGDAHPGRLVLLDIGSDRESLRRVPAAAVSGQAELVLRAGLVVVPAAVET
ncbi:hypothetical protein ACIOD2_46945 [Amycolatopsis sp. NPDC088138]|uniref:hypothetical protein n=1 Tax=Amycolatopsis sp. NPDC088138 TaxID=3363938 RepID=UPI00382A7F10